MTITDDTISTTHAGNKIKFGANNLVTTGTINAADITLSGTVSSTGIMTGASGSQFGDVKIEDGKITTSATNNTLSFELNNISTSGTLSSGDATIGDVTSGSITATGTGSFSSTITAASGSKLGNITVSNGSITSENDNLSLVQTMYPQLALLMQVIQQ